MSANLDALVQGIRAKRSEKLPQAQAHLERLKAAREAVVTTRTRAAAVAANNPDLQTKLGGVRYETALQLLETAIKSADRAVKRLSRESINIGVAGMARQGKSQILQMLTGLGDEQIPTGDGGFCTAARSVVTNGSAQSAVIHFMTEEDLMAKKVRPAYASVNSREGALGLSPMPPSLQAFLSQPVPQLHANPNPSELFYWSVLNEFHQTLASDPSLVGRIGAAPMTVPLSDVRRYVAKDTGAKDSEVVDHVEIVTPFSVDLPTGMIVFDLPGLGEMSPVIRATMLQTISEETDIVLLMRKPSNSGDGWQEKDFELMDMLKKVYPDGRIKPCDWVQVVLNHDRRPSHDNTRNVDLMLQNAPADIAPVKCDCGSQVAVREMINSNMDRLVQMTACIDDFRISEADASYSAAMDEVRAVYRNLREASSDIVADQCGFNFKRKFTDFMSDLRDPLKKDLKDLSPELMVAIKDILVKNFSGAAQKMKDLYAAYDDKDDFPQDFPIYSKRYLTSKFGAANAPIDPIGESVRNQREALFKLCRDVLEGCCQQLNAAYFENVAAKVFENKAVSMATRDLVADATDSRGKIEAFSALLNREGHSPTLASAVAGLLSFNLTFESTILPALYGVPAFADFNPESPTLNFTDMVTDINSIQTKEERADCLYNWQKWRCEQILSDATSGTELSPLTVISTYVSNIMQANFSSFVFSFIWGEDCTNEWERLVKSNQSVFWKDEFEAAARNSEISRAWSEALSALRTLVG